jgi:hypothetical protein
VRKVRDAFFAAQGSDFHGDGFTLNLDFNNAAGLFRHLPSFSKDFTTAAWPPVIHRMQSVAAGLEHDVHHASGRPSVFGAVPMAPIAFPPRGSCRCLIFYS